MLIHVSNSFASFAGHSHDAEVSETSAGGFAI